MDKLPAIPTRTHKGSNGPMKKRSRERDLALEKWASNTSSSCWVVSEAVRISLFRSQTEWCDRIPSCVSFNIFIFTPLAYIINLFIKDTHLI